MRLRPIGVVHSPFKLGEDVPRECESIVGEIEVFEAKTSFIQRTHECIKVRINDCRHNHVDCRNSLGIKSLGRKVSIFSLETVDTYVEIALQKVRG